MGEMRRCGNCGEALAPGASFCRACGARYEEPRTMEPGRPRRTRVAGWAALAIVVLGAGAAAAILLASGGGSATTTVVVNGKGTTTDEPPEAPTAGAIEAARYVQAGSFRSPSNAAEEQDRLAAAGIEVQVVSSDWAQEFYPGFQVLLAGPVHSESEADAIDRALERNGVPSAFARDLTPALESGIPADAGGVWSGVLDRSSGERPSLNGSLEVTLTMEPDGETGALEVEGSNCRESLALSETTASTLSYSQDRPCVAGGPLHIRPIGPELMVSVLPPESDVLATGTLTAG
jgi:sporulation related protein/zinc ribbon protein